MENNTTNILKNPKFKAVLIIIFIAIIIGIIIRIIYVNIFSAKINFLIAPKDATILINDAGAPSSGMIRVQPGNYTITVSMPGFETQTKNIAAVAGQETNVYLGLNSNDPSTANWYIDHPEDQERLDKIGSLIYTEMEQLLNQDYPIISKLPYESRSFTIGYDTSLEHPFILQISASSGFYNAGIAQANSIDPDHDIANYLISFTTIGDGYINPFSNLTLTANQNISSVLNTIPSAVKTATIKSINDTSDQNYKFAIIDYYEDDPIYKDSYRVILYKEGDAWVPVTNIELILSYENYPNLPKEIIKVANGL